MTMTRLPALGQAGLGDWRARIVERLGERGFQTVTEFAESATAASLLELADVLSVAIAQPINLADVSGEHLLQLWRSEAKASGPAAAERFAREILARQLRGIPGGWRSDWMQSTPEVRAARAEMESAITGWMAALDETWRPNALEIYKGLLADGEAGAIPHGWLPANANDSLLVEMFRKRWQQS